MESETALREGLAAQASQAAAQAAAQAQAQAAQAEDTKRQTREAEELRKQRLGGIFTWKSLLF